MVKRARNWKGRKTRIKNERGSFESVWKKVFSNVHWFLCCTLTKLFSILCIYFLTFLFDRNRDQRNFHLRTFSLTTQQYNFCIEGKFHGYAPLRV